MCREAHSIARRMWRAPHSWLCRAAQRSWGAETGEFRVIERDLRQRRAIDPGRRDAGVASTRREVRIAAMRQRIAGAVLVLTLLAAADALRAESPFSYQD